MSGPLAADAIELSDPLAYFNACLRAERAAVGRATVGLLGRTGAGKSTLVNGVFGDEVAATGVGAPVTEHVSEHRAADAPLTLLDTVGYELGGDAHAWADEIAALVERRASGGVEEALHVVWYCVDVEQSRIEEAEEALLRRVAAAVPTLVVLTQSFGADDEATVALRRHVEALALGVEGVLGVLARERTLAGTAFDPHGLDALVAATVSLLPEGARRAFVITQRQTIEAQVTEARAAVARRALEAGGLALRGDVVEGDALVRHHLRTLAEVSTVFSVSVPETQLQALVTVVSRGTSGAEQLTRRLLGLLEQAGVPGVQAGAMALNAGAAAATTRILGEGYARLCREIALRRLRGEELVDAQLIEVFRVLVSEVRR